VKDRHSRSPNHVLGQGVHARVWVTLFVVAAAVRVATALWIGNPAPYRDQTEYDLLARNLVEYGTLSLDEQPPIAPSAYREPGYPLLIAASYMLFGTNPMVAVICQSILGAFGLVLFCALVLRLHGRYRPGLIVLAALVYLVLGIVSTNWTILMREDLLCTVALAVIWIAARGIENPRATTWAGLGLMIGCGMLIKATMVCALFAVVIVLCGTLRLRQAVVASSIAITVAAACTLPAIHRNYRQFGQPSLACTVGLNLYLHSGQPEHLAGVEAGARELAHDLAARWPDVDEDLPDSHRDLHCSPGWMHFCQIFRQRLSEQNNITPEAADAIMARITMEEIRRDIPHYLRETLSQLTFYLSGGLVGGRPVPELIVARRSLPVRIYREFVEPAWMILIELFALIGLYLARRSHIAWLMVLLAATTLSSHSLLADARFRFRILADVQFAVLALHTVTRGYDRWCRP